MNARIDRRVDEKPRELAIIDAGVADPERLAASLRPDIDVVHLAGEPDGLTELVTRLGGIREIDVLHILAHGGPGRLTLGAREITADSVREAPGLFATLSRMLSPEATIRLDACRVASGRAGRALLAALGATTGANVAGSDRPVGAATKGGDWALNLTFGRPATRPAVGDGAHYPHVLADMTTTGSGFDTSDGTNLNGVSSTDDADTLTVAAAAHLNGSTVSLKDGTDTVLLDFADPADLSLLTALDAGNDTEILKSATNNVTILQSDFAGLDTVDFTPSGATDDTLIVSGGGGIVLTSPSTMGLEEVVGDATAADTVTGTNNGETTRGRGGNDSILGGSGDDMLIGGTGDDTLNGGAGADSLSGGAGSDTISGGSGGDRLDGGAGSDSLVGSDGDDVFVFSSFAEFLTVNDIADTTVSGGNGVDRVEVDFGGATVTATAFDDKIAGIEELVQTKDAGGAIAITLDATDIGNAGLKVIDLSADTDAAGANTLDLSAAGSDLTLTGSAGADTLKTGGGDDSIVGGGGADTIAPGTGTDTLTGGAGTDTFKDTDAALDGSTITDFAQGDVVRLTGSGGAATDGSFLQYDSGSGTLTLDTAAPGSDNFDAGDTRITLQNFTSTGFNVTTMGGDALITMNAEPRVVTNNGRTVDEGATAGITASELAINDPEQDSVALTVTVDSTPSRGLLFVDGQGAGSNDGTRDGEPPLGQGGTFTVRNIGNDELFYVHDGSETTSDSFAFSVADGVGGTTSGSFALTVTPKNDNPSPSNDTATSQAGQAETIAVLDNDGDPENDSLTVSAVTPSANATASINDDDTISYTANADFIGTDTLTYTVSDGNGGSASGTVTITVNEDVNDAPVANDDSFTLDEDAESVTLDVASNDTDADGDTLSVSLKSTPSDGSAKADDSGITYTPDADFNGTDSFTYTVSDGKGGFDSATANIAITAKNDDPVPKDDSFQANSNETTTLDVLENDIDIDGDALTVTLNETPANGSAQVTANNSIAFQPDSGFTGTTSFKHTVTDTAGAKKTATVEVNVVLDGTNTAPNATDDNFTITEDTKTSLDVLRNDSDPDGDGLTVTLKTTPQNATATMAEDGTVTLVPDKDFFGRDSFAYTISDPAGATDTATANLAIAAVNDPPTAKDDKATVPDGLARAIDVLANDSDVEGQTLSVTITDTPADASARVNDANEIVVTADAGASGETSIPYTVSDGNGGTAQASLNLTIEDTSTDLGLLDMDTPARAAALYVGYFGRAPDPAGFDFWVGQLDKNVKPISEEGRGQSPAEALDGMAESLRLDNEAQGLFPFLTPENAANASTEAIAAFVTSVFENLFDRPANGTADDPATGLGFWTDQIRTRLDSDINIGDIVVDIVSGAQNADAAAVANKIEIAEAYGDTLDQAEHDHANARGIVADVTADETTVQDALTEIETLAGSTPLTAAVDPMLV